MAHLRFLLSVFILICLSITTIAQEDSIWERITLENAENLDLLTTIDVNDLLGTKDLMLFSTQLSPDGRYFGGYLFSEFSGQEDDHFFVVDLYTQELVFDIESPNQGFPLGANSFTLSNNAQWFATVVPNEDETSTVSLYEVETEALTNSWQLDSYLVDIEFSPNNAYLGFSYGNSLILLSLEDNKVYDEFELVLDADNQEQAPVLAFSPDSSLIAFSTGAQFHLYELASLSELFHKELNPPAGTFIFNMIFISDASKVLVADSTGLVYLMNLDTGQLEELGSRDMAYFSIQISHENPRDVFGLQYSEGMSFLDLSSMTYLAMLDIGSVFDTSVDGQLAIAQAEQFSAGILALIAIADEEILTEIDLGNGFVPLINAYISPNNDYIAIVMATGEINLYGVKE